MTDKNNVVVLLSGDDPPLTLIPVIPLPVLRECVVYSVAVMFTGSNHPCGKNGWSPSGCSTGRGFEIDTEPLV